MKPKVFVASSSLSLDLANAVHAKLDDFADVTVWDQDVFVISRFNLENLSVALSLNDFGVFVLSPDDTAVMNGETVPVTRDNVMIELGMFLGGLGLKRCFILAPTLKGKVDIHLPTDLLGFSLATYNVDRQDDNKQSMVSPACEKIKAAIKKEFETPVSTCEICRHKHILHYIPPSKEKSVFFDTFLKQLSLSLWRLHDHRLKIYPYADPYYTLDSLIRRVRDNDAILFVPKDMNEGKYGQLSKTLAAHPNCRLVFADRQPPNDLIKNYPNVSFIGINNRRTGVLAAFCLYDDLSESKQKKAYLVIEGPGGTERSQWCVYAIRQLDQGALVETIHVEDLGRFDTGTKLTKKHKEFFFEHSDCSIGIFAGNDETASSICHQVIEEGVNNVKIVGCDATREMRQWVDNKKSSVICTIYNKILEEPAIEFVLSAIDGIKTFEVLDPVSYPDEFSKKMANNTLAMELWGQAK